MIRAMREEDAEAVAALVRVAFAAIVPPLDPAPSGLRVTADEVAGILAQGGGAVWDEAGLQGCVLWRPRERRLYLSRLAVRPGCWGRGIARALLVAAEAAARAGGWSVVALEVRLALEGNRRMFAAAGFVEGALRAHPGYAVPTFVVAEKRLAVAEPTIHDATVELDGRNVR